MAGAASRGDRHVYLREGELIRVDGRVGTVQGVDMTVQTVDIHWAGDAGPTTVTLDSITEAVDLRPACSSALRPPKLHLVQSDLVLEKTAERLAQAREAATGYRSGSPTDALPGEPQPAYDPARVNYMDRFANKAAELKHNGPAARLGARLSAGRLRGIWEAYAAGDDEAALDRRHVRTTGNRTSVTPEAEAVFRAVHEELRSRSTVTRKTRWTMCRQRLLANEATRDDAPSVRTIQRWHYERFSNSELGGKGRTRNSATTPNAEFGWFRQNPTYPGELAVADTNHTDVLLEGSWLKERVNAVVVVVVDWYSRSVMSLRVVEKAEKSIDVSRVMHDTMRPKVMRADWADELRWPYAGIPEHLLALPPGTRAAGLPYAAVAAWVFDHGSTYKSRDSLKVAERTHSDILPARKATGADKAVIERFFGTMNMMLLQWLDGHRGSDVGERGYRIEDKATYTAQELEDILLRWVITEYQNHFMDGVKPPWTPEGEWTPNDLYEEAMKRTGLAQPVGNSDDYYESFPVRYAAITGRGVKIGQLWYDNRQEDGLGDFRDQPNPFGSGKEKNRYEFRKDPYDNRSVWWRNPSTGRWFRLDWVAGSRETLPVFGDADVVRLNQVLKASNGSEVEQGRVLEVLVHDVLCLDQAASSKKLAQQASRRVRGVQAEAESRRSYGIETPAETLQDQTDQAEQAVDAARGARRRALPPVAPASPLAGLKAVPAAPASSPEPPAVPGALSEPEQDQPVLTVVPTGDATEPSVITAAPALGAAFANPFSRLAAGTVDDEEPQP